MKTLIFIFTLVFGILQTGYSQENWQNHYRDNDLDINFRYVDCHDKANGIHKSLAILQFVNKTGGKINVNYDKATWYGNKCIGCEGGDEYHFTLALAPNQTLEGSCEKKREKGLYVFHKMLDVKSSKMDKFELKNIKVAKAE